MSNLTAGDQANEDHFTPVKDFAAFKRRIESG